VAVTMDSWSLLVAVRTHERAADLAIGWSLGHAALVSIPVVPRVERHQKSRGPDVAHGSGLVLGGLAARG
jgi:hypothetical protein